MTTPGSSRRRSSNTEQVPAYANGQEALTGSGDLEGGLSLAEIQRRLLRAQTQLRAEHDQLRATQAQLKASRQRYADLFEFAPVGYVTLDRDGTIQEVNSTAVALLADSASLLRGCSFATLVAPADATRFAEHLRTCWTATEGTVVEITLCRRNGSLFPAQVTTTPARDDGNGGAELRTTIIDLTELKRTQDALQQAKDELEARVQERTAELQHANEELSAEVERRNRLEAELLDISEREKRRFGQDLHDETCQSLAGLSLLARVIAKELRDSPAEVHAKVESLSDQLRLLVEQTRSIARGLHPVTLSGGLVQALEELGDRVQERVPCRLSLMEEPELSDSEKLALYRIAQEATHNAVRHAQASQIDIVLRRCGTLLQLAIEDNGIGLPQTKRSSRCGMGLDIMGYRARSIDASLCIERKPNGGVRVICSLPGRGGMAGKPVAGKQALL